MESPSVRFTALCLLALASCTKPNPTIKHDHRTEPAKAEPAKPPVATEEPDRPLSPDSITSKESHFESGINIAWVDFARDVGTGAPNLPEIRRQLAQLARSGGTVARLWLHTNGALTPEFTGDLVTGPGKYLAKDLIKILDVAKEQNVKLMLTLWSFDMLRAEMKKEDPKRVPRNRLLVTDTGYLKHYLDKALAPLVLSVKNHPALHSWDICNEPEGMSINEGWSLVDQTDRVEIKAIQVFVNRIAGKIRKVAPENLITVGAVSFKYLDKNGPLGNIYSDQALITAGGDPLGYLDYYQGHHYASKGKEFSPFQRSAQTFGFDKPAYVGEFDMKEYLDYDVESPRVLYTHLRDTGYQGALGWKDGAIPAMNLMMNAIAQVKHPAPKTDDPDSCEHFEGGYGTPFFVSESLYRKKTLDGGSDVVHWCIVD